MILNQQAKVTHVVERLDDEVRKHESGYFRLGRDKHHTVAIDASQPSREKITEITA
ncbi:hypothetical protein [Stenomitos frigidus]|uniref:hypothetical protein n=1 Tax=Stenomitos frigidus TaxID=1886765 RepID=UPI001C62CF63|nr:hypothetical protein [Stenomitos frigidus]